MKPSLTSGMKTPDTHHRHDKFFTGLLRSMHSRVQTLGSEPVFTTDANAWGAYIASFSAGDRQYHNCNCCRHFLERYGNLVVIAETGEPIPLLWDITIKGPYRNAVLTMHTLISAAQITGAFMTEGQMGVAAQGQRTAYEKWEHLHSPTPLLWLSDEPVASMATLDEDYKNVLYARRMYSKPLVAKALALLRNGDAMYRSEKVLGPIEWLFSTYAMNPNQLRRACSLAPAGFKHPRSSMAGSLLDDLQAGSSMEQVATRFAAKMNPLKYQRPTAAPKEQTVDKAEELFAKMGLAPSLARKFASITDVPTVWTPSIGKPVTPKVGLFSSTRTTPLVNLMPKPKPMTWHKFSKTYLPSADSIEILCGGLTGDYGSILTALWPSSEPLVQWDSLDKRNPASWFVMPGSGPSRIGVRVGFQPVKAIVLQPNMFNGGFEHQGKGVMFAIEGAVCSKINSLCLFPEILRSELHGVRSVIERYSANGVLSPVPASHQLTGRLIQDAKNFEVLLRVTSGRTVTEITLKDFE